MRHLASACRPSGAEFDRGEAGCLVSSPLYTRLPAHSDVPDGARNYTASHCHGSASTALARAPPSRTERGAVVMASQPLSAPPPSHPEAPIPSAPPTILKFVLIGDAATGKTAFRERFIRDRFTGIYRATIGCDFLGRVVQVERVPGYDIDDDDDEAEAEPQGPDEARLQVWDTAGESLASTTCIRCLGRCKVTDSSLQARNASAPSPQHSTAPPTPASSCTRSPPLSLPPRRPNPSRAGSTSSAPNVPSTIRGCSAGRVSGPRRTRFRGIRSERSARGRFRTRSKRRCRSWFRERWSR